MRRRTICDPNDLVGQPVVRLAADNGGGLLARSPDEPEHLAGLLVVLVALTVAPTWPVSVARVRGRPWRRPKPKRRQDASHGVDRRGHPTPLPHRRSTSGPHRRGGSWPPASRRASAGTARTAALGAGVTELGAGSAGLDHVVEPPAALGHRHRDQRDRGRSHWVRKAIASISTFAAGWTSLLTSMIVEAGSRPAKTRLRTSLTRG